MKIIVCSDIHGNKYAFDAFLESIEKISYDKIVFCGDVFGYYYYADEIAKKMQESFVCLLGNHDKMLLDAWDNKYSEEILFSLVEKYGSVYSTFRDIISSDTICFLRSLDSKYIIECNGLKLGFFHGTPDDPLDGRLYPNMFPADYGIYNQFNYVFLGHTHHKMVRYFGETTVLNPGSLGQQRDGKGCSYLIFDSVKEEFEFKSVDFDREKLVRDIRVYDNGMEKLVEVLFRESVK